MKKTVYILKAIEWEAVLWLVGLIYLLLINPYQEQHFTLCPFRNIGITFCPGCGLGKAISFFYHGDVINSIRTHPFGIIAFFLISFRVIKLIFRTKNNLQLNTEENNG
ncbi:DUF2752 domain-containing protein [Melioribacteraceae bacterium 4301-Me]|uniref:DUF2752 domain-containing protein n=1 Tax=Pyranulibacter aquaticus TaxID=3163344 RepID=UPI0035995C04